MKKILLSICLFNLLTFFSPPPISPSSLSSFAQSYCVMDASTYEVLEKKNPYLIRSVASISKTMTALLALESNHLFDIVKVTDIIKTIEGSSCYLEEESEITLIDLVYGLMLRSGNDCGVLIASYLCKDIDTFVEKMNQKALDFQMNHTTFHNPTGLDIFDEGNLSCSYDMALLFSHALENQYFRKIVGTKYFKTPLKGEWKNKNKLLFSYEYCIGGKTGYTKKAKRTLLTAASKDSQTLTICSINAGNDFETHKNIYEYYFNKYYYIVLLIKGKNLIEGYCLYSDHNIGIRLEKEKVQQVDLIYYINPSNCTLQISCLINQNEMIKSKVYEGVYLLSN